METNSYLWVCPTCKQRNSLLVQKCPKCMTPNFAKSGKVDISPPKSNGNVPIKPYTPYRPLNSVTNNFPKPISRPANGILKPTVPTTNNIPKPSVPTISNGVKKITIAPPPRMDVPKVDISVQKRADPVRPSIQDKRPKSLHLTIDTPRQRSKSTNETPAPKVVPIDFSDVEVQNSDYQRRKSHSDLNNNSDEPVNRETGIWKAVASELEALTQQFPKRFAMTTISKDSNLDYKKCFEAESSKTSALRSKIRDRFKDDTFLANRGSIYKTDMSASEQYDKKFKKWTSIVDIAQDEDSIYRFDPEAVDFRQGSLGNCWQVTALACLVNSCPKHLEKIIPDREFKTKTTKNMFWTMLCIDGKWQAIRVDDHFPTNSEDNLVFTQALNHQFYAPIIEKSLAKHFSCYQALEAGVVDEGFSMLTGNPSYIFFDKDKQNILRIIEASLEKGYLVSGSNSRPEKTMLVNNHAYAIFDINAEAIKMWNPWAEQELSPEMKAFDARMRTKNDTQGQFWIKKSLFVEWFDKVVICKFQPQAKISRFEFKMPLEITSEADFPHFKLEVSKQQPFDFSIYQPVIREHKNKCNLQFNILIFKLESQNRLKLVGKSAPFGRSIFSFCKILEPGKYIVSVMGFNYSGETARIREAPKLVLAIQSMKKFDATQVTCDSSLIGDMLIELALSTSTPASSNKQYKYSITGNDFSAGLYVIANADPEQHCMVTTRKKSDTTNYFSLRDNEGETYDIIPPQSIQIVSLGCMICDRKSSNLHFAYEFAMENKRYPYPKEEQKISLDVKDKGFLFAPRRITEADLKAIVTMGEKDIGDQFVESLWLDDTPTSCWSPMNSGGTLRRTMSKR